MLTFYVANNLNLLCFCKGVYCCCNCCASQQPRLKHDISYMNVYANRTCNKRNFNQNDVCVVSFQL